MDNNFKTTSSSNRKLNKRYSENGVFSMGCTHHGIPERLYGISGGEGYIGIINTLRTSKRTLSNLPLLAFDIGIIHFTFCITFFFSMSMS